MAPWNSQNVRTLWSSLCLNLGGIKVFKMSMVSFLKHFATDLSNVFSTVFPFSWICHPKQNCACGIGLDSPGCTVVIYRVFLLLLLVASRLMCQLLPLLETFSLCSETGPWPLCIPHLSDLKVAHLSMKTHPWIVSIWLHLGCTWKGYIMDTFLIDLLCAMPQVSPCGFAIPNSTVH